MQRQACHLRAQCGETTCRIQGAQTFEQVMGAVQSFVFRLFQPGEKPEFGDAESLELEQGISQVETANFGAIVSRPNLLF